MQIVIIHDFGNYDRYTQLMQQLRTQNIGKFHIQSAVHDTHSAMKGINLAHKQAVQMAKDNLWDEVCIMEDDVVFTHPNSFQYFLDNKPQDFDLYLSGIYIGEISPQKTVKSFTGLHCYIVNCKFYDTFLSTPTEAHIDRALSDLGDFHVCYPFAAIQSNGWSSNTKTDMNYDSLLANRELYLG